MDKLPCIANTKHTPETKITTMGTSFPAREFRVIESFNWLSLGQLKYLKKPKKEKHRFHRRSGKFFLEQSVQEIFEHL